MNYIDIESIPDKEGIVTFDEDLNITEYKVAESDTEGLEMIRKVLATTEDAKASIAAFDENLNIVEYEPLKNVANTVYWYVENDGDLGKLLIGITTSKGFYLHTHIEKRLMSVADWSKYLKNTTIINSNNCYVSPLTFIYWLTMEDINFIP